MVFWVNNAFEQFMKLMFTCVLSSLGRDWPKVITGWQLLSGDQFRMNWWIPFSVEWMVFCEGSWWCNHSVWDFSSGGPFMGSVRQWFLHSSANILRISQQFCLVELERQTWISSVAQPSSRRDRDQREHQEKFSAVSLSKMKISKDARPTNTVQLTL